MAKEFYIICLSYVYCFSFNESCLWSSNQFGLPEIIITIIIEVHVLPQYINTHCNLKLSVCI